jgi:hypothetical protein
MFIFRNPNVQVIGTADPSSEALFIWLSQALKENVLRAETASIHKKTRQADICTACQDNVRLCCIRKISLLVFVKNQKNQVYPDYSAGWVVRKTVCLESFWDVMMLSVTVVIVLLSYKTSVLPPRRVFHEWRCKPENHGLNSRWCHWNSSMI